MVFSFLSFLSFSLFFSFSLTAKFFMNDPLVPRACKNNNKVNRFARELSDFCRMNGLQRLALSREQCTFFLTKQGITAAEQLASGMCCVLCSSFNLLFFFFFFFFGLVLNHFQKILMSNSSNLSNSSLHIFFLFFF